LVAVPLVCSEFAFAQTSRRGKTQRPAPQTQSSPQANADFEQFVKRGDEARLALRLDEAVTLYGRALKIKPTWPDGWWYIGAILYEKDLYAQGRDAFQNLVTLEPTRGQAWAMLGLCQFQTGEYERAVVSLQRGRAQGINDNSELASVVRYHTAILYIRFEQFEIAFDILREFMRFGHYSLKWSKPLD
jgi:tetratricopeptide (TPR) repeat protein